MANKTFKNQGGGVGFTFAGGKAVRVETGESYTTSDPEEQAALRKSGKLTESSPSSTSTSSSTSSSTYSRKEKY